MVELRFDNGTDQLVQSGKVAGAALPIEVVRSVRHRLTLIKAAPDLVTLVNWRSFGLMDQKSIGDVRSVQINDNWEMAVRFQCDESPNRATVLGVRITR